MMKKRLITTVSALISACTLLSAQNEDVTVKGSIVSADDGSPVDYATIILSPSNAAAASMSSCLLLSHRALLHCGR